jgi:acetolactate synthase-1/2/3 large subunit
MAPVPATPSAGHPTRTTAEALLHRLAQHGVERVFGIPGTHNLPLYRALADVPLQHTAPRHEQGGGYAADGYARATGRPALCLTTSGPGVMNAATALAQAYSDSVPLLLLAPSMPSDVDGHDTGYLHESKDQQGVFAALALRSERIRSPHDAIAAVDRAMVDYATGRRRPIHWDVPLEAFERSAPVPDTLPALPAPPAPSPAAVEHALELLHGAERCALVLGGGAVDAGAEATALARRLGAPVVTTVNGKGTVSEHDPRSLGASIRLATAQALLRDCDVVIAVGTELAESDLWRRPPLELHGRLVRIDVDPAQLHKNQLADVAIAGDARRTLQALLDGLPAAERGTPPGLLEGLRRGIEQDADRDGAHFRPLIAALAEGLAGNEDAILTNDSAMACYYGAAHYLPVTGSRRFLYPTGYATLGYALPAAIGAKLGRPSARVAALIGDGGLLFTVAELSTAAAEGLALPIVVHDNHCYGEIKREMVAEGIPPLAVDLPGYDAAGLATAFGLHAARVDDLAELPGIMRAAFEADRPTLIVTR